MPSWTQEKRSDAGTIRNPRTPGRGGLSRAGRNVQVVVCERRAGSRLPSSSRRYRTAQAVRPGGLLDGLSVASTWIQPEESRNRRRWMVYATLDSPTLLRAGWSGIDVNNLDRLGDCLGLNRPHRVAC